MEDNNQKTISIKDLNDFVIAMQNQGFLKGQNYGEPSKGTIKLFEKVDYKMLEMDKKIDRICDCLFGVEGDEKSGVVKCTGRIEEHAIYTNGRVTKLELWQAGVIAISAILSIALPTTIWWFINKFDTLNTQVISHIASDTENFNRMK